MNDLAIFIPTLGRAHKLEAVYRNAIDNTPGAHIYFIIEKSDDGSLNTLKEKGYSYITNDRSNNYAGAINTAYLNTTEKYFFCGADDLNFNAGWADKAFARMVDPIKVVGTNDLHNEEVLRGEHATHYLVDREYIITRSGVFDVENLVLPENYVHNWTDREFIEIAKIRGVFVPCLEARVEHLHWGWGLSPKDATYAKQDGSWNGDAALYNQRIGLLREKIRAEQKV